MLIDIRQNTPRWIIFLIDLIICTFSVLLAYLLRFNFSIPSNELSDLPKVLIVILIIRFFSFIIAKTYAGIVRYTNTRDSIRIFLVVTSGSVIFTIINLFKYYSFDNTFLIPFSIVIIDYLCTLLAMNAFRIIVKVAFLEIKNPSSSKTNVIIFGAGESGVITKRTLERDAGMKYKVFAFIDDDIKKSRKMIEGISIYAPDKLQKLLETNTIAHVVISIKKLNPERRKEISELCLQYNSKVLVVPPVERWINGELSFKQIKKIKIEDLLERDVIKLDKKEISKQLHDKVILVTGASGSIGSEIARQVLRYSPKKVILLDQAETPLFHLEIELLEEFRQTNFEVVIGDIRNTKRMERTFDYFKPDIVYHAAAYKHVPLMENNPSEAIHTNVEGTKVIADLSLKYNVKKFVMISTDKAVGPITITDPDVTRYFMTIPEACSLVLDAGAMGNGGEIFIFDMGKSVKIFDLAKKMIQLSGLTLGKDIQIIFTGLRPGEKLYEELLNDKENTIETHHPRIMIAKNQEMNTESVSKNVNELIEMFGLQNNNNIVSKMKEIIPEYISNNSIFTKLDN